MGDGWKILRSGEGKATEPEPDYLLPGDGEPEQAPGGPEGAFDAGAAARETAEARVDRYGSPVATDEAYASRYGDPVSYENGALSGEKEGVPRKHIVIALSLLAVVFMGWLFKEEVRGVASWAAAAARGEDVPLSATAPGLARLLRFNKPYAWEEFLGICREGSPEPVREILDKQPEFMHAPDGTPLLHALAARGASPEVLRLVGRRTDDKDIAFRDKDGGTLLHALASGGLDAGAFAALEGKGSGKWVNLTDKSGKTALHIAASKAGAGVVLLLRGMGADPAIRDNSGRTPLDCFMENWGDMPRSVTAGEKAKFSAYGYHVPVPFSSGRDGRMRTRFVSIADQVPDMERKRYFTLLAEATVVARQGGFPVPAMAAGDMPGPPTDKGMEILNSFGQDPLSRNRPEGKPLWKGLELRHGTGAAMAKFKALLPEAYPLTLNYFSALLAGEEREPPFGIEWNAWDVPEAVRLALMMRMLQERLRKSGSRLGNSPGGTDWGASATRAYRERGDTPGTRNPLLMTWVLLEYDRPGAHGLPEALNLSPVPAAVSEQAKDGNRLVTELPNLRALHARLPEETWRVTGRHLVAAAYVAEKRQAGSWGAGMMPDALQKAGGLRHLRLWGCGEESGPAGPLRAVLEASVSLPPELATAMTALILRSGPESTALGPDGKTPLEFAESLPGAGVPESVKAMLKAAPRPPATQPAGGKPEGGNA